MARWNTRYLDAAVARLRAEGHGSMDEHVARLSLLEDQDVNLLGRYPFNIPAGCPGRNLRPLPAPDAPQDGDKGAGRPGPVPFKL
ncbi:Tn3 family transposase [Streptomyces virginiae]|uniref:Tn3 family transposase n=1 Tax=Streptomyces virginiae TaxID=1961 RepID=UPI003689671F